MKITVLSIVTSLSLILFGCGGLGAPNCSDADAKKLVVEIGIESFQNLLIGLNRHKQIVSFYLRGNSMSDAMLEGFLQNIPTYKQLKKREDKDEKIEKIISGVDGEIAKLELTLVGIRTDGKNDEIKKCECRATLTVAGIDHLREEYSLVSAVDLLKEEYSIKYTVQYTEDEMIYVEVRGLPNL